jgi:hypothetical protein
MKVVFGLVRLTGVAQVILGLLFWAGLVRNLVPVHMAIGLTFVIAIWALAALAGRAGVGVPRVALAVAWGALVIWFGMVHPRLLPGDLHWIIQVAHLLVGIAAMGMADSLVKAARARSGAADRARSRERLGGAQAALLLLAVLPLSAAAAPLAAQSSAVVTEPGAYARIVTIAPKPGQDSAFEAGYARHIEWHRANRDPWTWYGWSFVLGPRMGRFMDGSFGHAAADLDRTVNPAGDGADNDVNVIPYADFVSHGVYRRLESGSRGAALPDTSSYLVLATYRVAPGREAEFEAGIAASATTANAPQGDGRWAWYRLELGGTGPEYLLMRGAPSWEGAVRAMERPALRLPPGTVETVTSELLAFRPTHSLVHDRDR